MRMREAGRRSCDTFGVSEHPRCAALTRDGRRCRTTTVNGSDFCQHHLGLLPEVGDESLRRGDHARPRRRETPLVRVVAEQDDGIGAEPSRAPVKTGNGSVTPAEVRPRLGELVAENLSELERVLVETATGADKPVWVTTTCKSCGRAGRHEVVIPDYRVRLDAVEKLLQQGLGRAPEAQEPPSARLPANVAAVENLSWPEMQAVFAATYVDEIAAVQRSGGPALVRQKLAGLSAGERCVLREALAET